MSDAYEKWTGYDSYAYLSVRDGPDDRSDFPPPTAMPEPDPLFHSLDPNRFTEAMGIEPTRTYRRGDLKRNGRYRTRNVWELRSSLPRDAAPHEHVRNVISQVAIKIEEFLESSSRYLVRMVVVSFGPNPELILTVADLAHLVQLRTSLWADMYCFDETTEDEGDSFSPLKTEE